MKTMLLTYIISIILTYITIIETKYTYHYRTIIPNRSECKVCFIPVFNMFCVLVMITMSMVRIIMGDFKK